MTTKTTERDLIEEVEELLAKATPGPWRWASADPDSRHGVLEYATGDDALWACDDVRILTDGSARGEYSPDIDVMGPDANLIERAPDLLRRLVKEVKTLQRFTSEVAELGCLRGRRVHCIERERRPANWCVACRAKGGITIGPDH